MENTEKHSVLNATEKERKGGDPQVSLSATSPLFKGQSYTLINALQGL